MVASPEAVELEAAPCVSLTTCFTWAWYEGVAFPTNHEYGRHNLLTKIQKRVYAETTVWAERHKHLWVTSIHSDATITIIVTALTSVHTLSKTTTSRAGRAEALWCHISGFKSSSAPI